MNTGDSTKMRRGERQAGGCCGGGGKEGMTMKLTLNGQEQPERRELAMLTEDSRKQELRKQCSK